MLKVSSRGQYLEILFNGDRKMLHYLSLVDEELEQLDDSLIGERERTLEYHKTGEWLFNMANMDGHST